MACPTITLTRCLIKCELDHKWCRAPDTIRVQDDKIEVQIGKLNKKINFGLLKAKVPIYTRDKFGFKVVSPRGTLLVEDVIRIDQWRYCPTSNDFCFKCTDFEAMNSILERPSWHFQKKHCSVEERASSYDLIQERTVQNPITL